MSDVASRRWLAAARLTKGAGVVSLFALLYVFALGARSPAQFFTLLSLVATTGAATSVLYAHRRDASRLVLVLCALVGAALTFFIVYGLFIVIVTLFGEG
jgi:hypothetical protein